MTSMSKTPDPSDQHYQNWLLPDVSSSANTIASVEKEQRDLAEKAIDAVDEDSTATLPLQEDESIDTTDESIPPMTAEQLQVITETAEKEGYETGYQRGYEEGKQAGHEDGMASATHQVQAQCEHLAQLVEALLFPLRHEQDALETLLLDMTVMLSRAVVARELHIDSSEIQTCIQQALSVLPDNTDKLSLYLNPQDLDTLQTYLNHTDHLVHYRTDADLLPGGCRLETKQTTVDCTVETRLQQVIEDFLHQQLGSVDEGNASEPGSQDA